MPRFGFASPVLAITYLSQKTAKTDRASIHDFEAAAEAFRFDLIQKLNHLHAHEVQRATDKTSKVSADIWRDMALFEYLPSQNHLPKTLGITIIFFWGLVAVAMLSLFWRGKITR